MQSESNRRYTMLFIRMTKRPEGFNRKQVATISWYTSYHNHDVEFMHMYLYEIVKFNFELSIKVISYL